jgi:hypothetical protein
VPARVGLTLSYRTNGDHDHTHAIAGDTGTAWRKLSPIQKCSSTRPRLISD